MSVLPLLEGVDTLTFPPSVLSHLQPEPGTESGPALARVATAGDIAAVAKVSGLFLNSHFSGSCHVRPHRSKLD